MQDNFKFCLALLHCDSEDEVISLLEEKGYWDKPELWRYYGDVENNWGQGGSQQSLAEAALAEKIVNSVDARLINECLAREIDPASSDAPQSIRAAVARFFEGGTGDKNAIGGLVEDWSNAKARQVANGITFCVTGVRPKQLNITIADCGEGQSPDRLPDTILSLSKSNKIYIPFVQGQFNQGGTGALRFCGEKNLQLVISRRNPKFLNEDSTERDREWCFTIVRRERPSGGRRNSIYTYLAPIGTDSEDNFRKGGVLSFQSESFPIFPNDDGPYEREANHGTAVKMFDYKFMGEKSNILRGNSLLTRLDLLLPEIALPVRFYEYRKNQNGVMLDIGSRETTCKGLMRRLKSNLNEGGSNIEDGFPIAIPFHPKGEKLIANIFAFKPGLSRSYRRSEGVVFVRNGQTQDKKPKDFFRRKAVKMAPLADDLLVFVECDGLNDSVREDLFMTNREHFVENDFRRVLDDALEKTIRDCSELRELRNRRLEERLREHIKDESQFEDVLKSLCKTSPNLKRLLDLGKNIPSSNKPKQTPIPEKEFKGKFYPTFFKLKGVEYGTIFIRSCPINQEMRITFETDARDDYFTRSAERGSFVLTWINKDGLERKASPIGPKLKSGIATVRLGLPDEVAVGDEVEFIAQVNGTGHEFKNHIIVSVKPKAERKPSTPDSPKFALPRIKRVYQEQWEINGFDGFTAMKVESIGYSGDEQTEIYEFKINMDNDPLRHEAKEKRLDDSQFELLRKQFLFANVLIGFSLLLEENKKKEKRQEDQEETPSERVEDRIDKTCRALAPFLPAILSLGTGDLEVGNQFEDLEEAV